VLFSSDRCFQLCAIAGLMVEFTSPRKTRVWQKASMPATTVLFAPDNDVEKGTVTIELLSLLAARFRRGFSPLRR
jgi:hypothetical protein